LASPLPSKSASIFRAREAGTRAFRMRFSRPGTISGAVFAQTPEGLRYALLDAHRFQRHFDKAAAINAAVVVLPEPWPPKRPIFSGMICGFVIDSPSAVSRSGAGRVLFGFD
jgi:hypothetical protein